MNNQTHCVIKLLKTLVHKVTDEDILLMNRDQIIGAIRREVFINHSELFDQIPYGLEIEEIVRDVLED